MKMKENVADDIFDDNKQIYKLNIIELTLLKEWKLNNVKYLNFWSDHITGLLEDNQITLLNCIERSKLFISILNDTYERHGNDFVNIDEILDNYELINHEDFTMKWYKDEDFIKAYNASGIKEDSVIRALDVMKNSFDDVLKK